MADSSAAARSQVSLDRYESTFVVSLDPSQGDFTTLQTAINALPASGGKIFVKAGAYPLTDTIAIKMSNVQIQGEGMGLTVLRRGFTHFRFVENLQIERVEIHDAYFTGIHLQSVRNSAISGCYIHHINDIVPVNPPNPANERYGIVVGCASQNVTINGCRFSHTRHAVTTGGSSGKNSNGVQRNIVVANCTSMLSDTAHFDTHQPAENVTFTGCAAIGGVPVDGFPATNAVVGFQMRGRNSSIVGCSVLQAIGKGIMIFGPVSSGAVISGNMIANVKAIGQKQGNGIFFDSQGTSAHSVIGNVIKNCEGSAVRNGGSVTSAGTNNDLVIQGNVIENVNSAIAGAAIQLDGSARVLISGNSIGASAQGSAIAMRGASDEWQIFGNHLSAGGGVALTGVGSVVVNNLGYNPVGGISNPWPSHGADLVNNVASGSAVPRSGIVYTVRHTPKTIAVSGGDVSQILINGAEAGSTVGTFKLGVGETISITYNISAPAALVFAE